MWMKIREKYMLTIRIDAGSKDNKSVSLLQTNGEEKVLARKVGDIDTVSALAEILHEQNLTLSQIDEFQFAQNTPSFTGIKMSAAVANVLSWAIKNTPIEKLPQIKYTGEPNIQV